MNSQPRAPDRQSVSIPWNDLMVFGLGMLGIAPGQFWQMTLRELDAAARAIETRFQVPPSMPRTVLEELIKRHPDQENRNTR